MAEHYGRGHSKKTPDLLERAKAMRLEGQSYNQIANAINVDPETVRRWLGPDTRNRTGKKTPELVEKARKMRERGNTYVDIGTAIGVNECTIREWLMTNDELGDRRERARIRRGYNTTKRVLGTEDIWSRIPKDDRNDIQRLLGEPPFERSALYQKMMEDRRGS